MKSVLQNSPTTCGQACIAMVRGTSLEQAIKRVGHSGIMTDSMMLVSVNAVDGFVPGHPPDDKIAIQKHREPGGTREHWTVSTLGYTLDPASIPADKRWPVTKHIIVRDPTAKEIDRFLAGIETDEILADAELMAMIAESEKQAAAGKTESWESVKSKLFG